MSSKSQVLRDYETILQAAAASDDGERCAVAPAPELHERLKDEMAKIKGASTSTVAAFAKASEPSRPGLNDGLIIPPENFPLGTPLSVVRSVAANRAPLRGVLRVIVVLVDFSDKPMTKTKAHFHDLFFSTGVVPTKSVREYYTEVTHGLIDIQGDVVGPFRLPRTKAQYAHAAAGLGTVSPNAQTMARDAVLAANPSVNFNPYDNDGNGYVDAFIVVHAGSGGEQTGNPNDIWSHKWVIEGGAKAVDNTRIYAYLTVPEDSRIGVCCHELGHLLFGFPDLYDTDQSSEGIGDWCLMASGSWGGGGDTPVHPSAWCKANQGWVAVDNRTTNGTVNIPDVKDSHTVLRLWKDGGPGQEYFLVENRQRNRFDASLPVGGLLVWHIDDATSGNTNESHYKVALMQADGRRDLEQGHNRGDAGDAYPGSAGNTSFHGTSSPSSKSYGNLSTCVSITAITPPGGIMTANIAVKCKGVEKRITKEIAKEILKDVTDTHKISEKSSLKELMDKRPEKSLVTEKPGEKLTDTKMHEGKLAEGGFAGGGSPWGPMQPADPRLAQLEARIAQLEAGANRTETGAAQPFIGADLRPDLSGGAFAAEEEYAHLHQQMQQGSADAKRLYDSKLKEG